MTAGLGIVPPATSSTALMLLSASYAVQQLLNISPCLVAPYHMYHGTLCIFTQAKLLAWVAIFVGMAAVTHLPTDATDYKQVMMSIT